MDILPSTFQVVVQGESGEDVKPAARTDHQDVLSPFQFIQKRGLTEVHGRVFVLCLVIPYGQERMLLGGDKHALMRKLCLILFCFLAGSSVWAEPIHQLVRDDQRELVAELLEAEKLSPSVSQPPLLARRVDGATPLLVAAFYGHIKMCELLLSYDADLEASDLMGDTPLFRALSEGHDELGLLLLSKGADLNRQNKMGETPFMMAARSMGATGFLEVLASTTGLEGVDSRGRTALHHAVEKDAKENVQLLLGAGADVNVRDKKGSTVLHKAVAMGDADLVKLLLEAGADVSAKDSRGRDSVRIAEERNDAPMARFLGQAQK